MTLFRFCKISLIICLCLFSPLAVISQTATQPAVTIPAPTMPATIENTNTPNSGSSLGTQTASNSKAPAGNSTSAKQGASIPVASTSPVSNLTNATPTSPINTLVAAPPDIKAAAYLLLDANSGYVLAQKDADVSRAPASLTKLMTMYVLSGLFKEGRIKLTDQVTISENAWRTGGSRMFVQVGTKVPAQDLVNGIIVASGNDACVAMAEHAAGTEAAFVNLMNQTAQKLGMKSTRYADTTGLPSPQNYTTAYDLAILARAIIYDYPDDYKWYNQKWMTYNNIKQPNRNLLLWRDPSVDGLKTGHTDDAGFCLVASANRNNMRLIAIVLGEPSMKQRATDVQALLNYGYHFFETHLLYNKDKPIANLPTWYGKNKETPLGLTRNMYVTVPTGQYKKITTQIVSDKPLEAPITKGQPYSLIQVALNDQIVASQPLVALADNPKANIISRSLDRLILTIQGWLGHSS